MIKFVMQSADGKSALWLGLSKDNMDRLPTEPIYFEMDELDSPSIDRIVLVAGLTETDIADRLRVMGLPIPEFPQPEPGEKVIRHHG